MSSPLTYLVDPGFLRAYMLLLYNGCYLYWPQAKLHTVWVHMENPITIIPDYPYTKDSQTGILHIIHTENPIPGGVLETKKDKARDKY